MPKAQIKKNLTQNIVTPDKLNAIKFQTYYEQIVSEHYDEGESGVRKHLTEYAWNNYLKDI